MISNIVLLGATSLLGYGYYNFKKEGKLVRLFDELIKIETYDVDYVSDFAELPQDKDIVLQGRILHNKENNKVSFTERDRDVVYNELIVVSPQVEESETDFYYKSYLSNNVQFSIGDNTKQIHFDFIPNQVNFYNPFKVVDKLDYASYSNQLSLVQKVQFQLFKKNSNLTEFALLPNSTFQFIGRVSPIPPNSSITPPAQGNATLSQGNITQLYRFTPRVIMSDNKDYLLQHLDRYLVQLNEKGRRYLGVGVGIFAMHFALTKIIFAPPKSIELPS